MVEGIVLMRKYEKSKEVSDAVKDKLEELNTSGLLPKGMKLVVFNQRTQLIEVTTHNVVHNLVVGMALVIGILFVFLGDLASAGIVALMIPLALLFSVTVLYVQGKSANLLSIGAVDFGIIVDSSVIIVENIYRHITSRTADRSRPLIDRIVDASSEIERALFFSTAIIVCAFIPLFSMTGPEGALFGPMANTYAFAIAGALMLAVTLAPVLCSFLFTNKKEEHDTWLDKVMKRSYLRQLSKVLAAPPADDRRDARAGGRHGVHGPAPGRRVHAAAGGGEPLDQGAPAADGLARRGRAVRPEAPRGDRLGARGPRGDVAHRPARRRHRRDQLLQRRVQRPAPADGGVADQAAQALGPRAADPDRRPRDPLAEAVADPRGASGGADGEVRGVPRA